MKKMLNKILNVVLASHILICCGFGFYVYFEKANQTPTEQVIMDPNYENTDSQVLINWNEVIDADGYRVYIKVDEMNIEVKKIDEAQTTSCIIENLDSNSTYNIKVKAYYETEDDLIFGNSSEILEVKTDFEQATFDSSSETDSTISLNWTQISGADGYVIYEKIKDEYVEIQSIAADEEPTYCVENLESNEEYSFKINAYYLVDDQVLWTSQSEEYKVTTMLSQVEITSSSKTDSQVRINWQEVSGALGYCVYLFDGDSYSAIADTESDILTYKLTDLDDNTAYSFKVQAYSTIGDDHNYGELSEVYTVKTDKLVSQTQKTSEIITPEAKTIFLTFDDGPSRRTLEILEILDKYDIKATFFVCAQTPAQRSDEAIEILNMIIDQGHEIGVHSYSHDYESIYSSVDAFFEDFDKLYNFIYENTGYEPTIYRFPGGSNTRYNGEVRDEIIEQLEERGFVYYDWNASNQDATGVSYTSEELADFAIGSLKENSYSIVLMHDLSTKVNTPKSVEILIQYALENDYTFDSLTNDIKPIQFSLN